MDPSIKLSTKSPLKNPYPGDYLLSKTASTEGIASKKSLELKKRYLLGETGMSGVFKSDSASALDNKFKSFHSNITECQKLLQPSEKIDRKNEINRIELSKETKDQSNSEEKENRSIDSNKKEYSETINTTLIENKIKSIVDKEKDVETIDLVTPEKLVDLSSGEVPKSLGENDAKMSETNMKIKTKLDSIFIDLTTDSPVKDRSLVETNVDFNVSNTVPDIISNITPVNGKCCDEERSRSPVHETTIQVPQIWNNSNNSNNKNNKSDVDLDTDSIDSEDSSSLDDIPHFILDSTTSPETQNENLLASFSSGQQPPRLEVRDTSGELMQIDSLMIIDGQYIGDPDDLELFESIPDQKEADSVVIVDDSIEEKDEDFEREKTPTAESGYEREREREEKEKERERNSIEKEEIKEVEVTHKKENSPERKRETTPIAEDREKTPILEENFTNFKNIERERKFNKEKERERKSSEDREKTPVIENVKPILEEREKVSMGYQGRSSVEREKDREREREKEREKEIKEIEKGREKESEREKTPIRESIISYRPVLRFDTKNENKIDTLKNLPLILPKDDEKVALKKPTMLRFSDKLSPLNSPDTDKTPVAGIAVSDSENDITGPGLTETELSDWTADDAVSENFVDIEFALNSNKGTMKRNKKNRIPGRLGNQNSTTTSFNKNSNNNKNGVKGQSSMLATINQSLVSSEKTKPSLMSLKSPSEEECGILKNLALDEIEFMDTGSENESCVESASTKNRVMLRNRGYVEFVEHSVNGTNDYNYYKQQALRQQKEQSPIVEAVNKEVAYIEQGACILSNDDLKTPMNEIPSENFDSLTKVGDFKVQPDSLNGDDIDDDSLVINTGPGTTTDESDVLTIVTSPLESPPQNGQQSSATTPTNNTSPEKSKTSSTSLEKSKEEKEEPPEMGYEEYVKSLQAKIAQISSNSGRDSLENRKSRRKMSRNDDKGIIYQAETAKIEPPPTLTRKLEEIKQKADKQKDIIHDLVMDKLQAKKQMNAEKRLNRSRNRTMFLGTSNNSLTSPSSNVSLTSAGAPSLTYGQLKSQVIPRISTTMKTKEDIERRHSIHTTPPKNEASMVPEKSVVPDPGKLNKTQSFCLYSMKQVPLKDHSDNDFPYKMPMPPPRQPYRVYDVQAGEIFRQNSRFKTNQDVGSNPDEKIQEIRRKYSFNNPEPDLMVTRRPSASQVDRNKSDDVKFREMKMSVSKSYNDISLIRKFSMDSSEYKRINDFVSDPNLIDAMEKEQKMLKGNTAPVAVKKPTKASRRDSERRKSLIQSVSDFFTKKKDNSASNKDLTSTSSPSKESGSSSGLFSRFRISPKSKENKEKSKVKDNLYFSD